MKAVYEKPLVEIVDLYTETIATSDPFDPEFGTSAGLDGWE